MKRTNTVDAKPTRGTASVTRSLADSLGVGGFQWIYFEVEPGETFSVCYHAHPDEEEIFYVLDGRATFETEDGEIYIESGEAVRFEPGEFQHGFNETEEPVIALAFSAPRDREIGGVIECPECGKRDHPRKETSDDGNVTIIVCNACGSEVNRKD
ncbi:MAG: cupin domain-containing protein [Halovenus sp.]